MIAMTAEDRQTWGKFAQSVLRAARDVGSLAFLQEPDAASLVPEGEPRRVVATALPDEGLVRVYLRLPAAPGQPQQMAHLGDLHESGEWRTGTRPITPKGPAH
jgi:hypothetical protein